MQTQKKSDVAPPSNMLLWVHLARIISVLGVISIHVAYPLTAKWGEISTKWWLIAEAANAFGRFSVPLFFALSGFLLLSRPEPVSSFFRKRFGKVVWPLLAWSVIYVIWANYWGERHDTFTSAIFSILSGPVADHLWFLYTLIGLYLTVPILWKMLQNDEENKLLLYFLGLWFVFVPLKNIVTMMFAIDIGFDFPLAGQYLGYFLLGHWLGSKKMDPKRHLAAILLFFIAVGLAIYGNYARSLAAGRFDNFFDNYLGLLIFIEVASMLVFLPGLEDSLKRIPLMGQRLLLTLGSASYGIYFVHLMFIEAFRRGYLGFKLSATSLHPLYGIPLTILAVFGASLLVTLLLKSIPILKKIVP
jgi:surface polysaccharide O-acyltransferase-like enzyme